MNIGIFTDTYYPQINGVATSAMTLKYELEKIGHKVYIITTSDPNAPKKVPSVFRLPSMPFVFVPTHRMTYMYSPRLILNFKKLKLDIIHTQTEFAIGLFGMVLSEVFRIPLVHTYHTMYEDYVHYVAKGHLITPKMAQIYSRIFCNRAKVVITPVEKTRVSLEEYGVVKPIEVIPTGLDFSALKRENYRREEIEQIKDELGISKNAPVVVYVGRIAQEKSLDVVMKAMAALVEKLPGVVFALIGNGPLVEQYKELAKSLGIEKNVVFAGARPYAEIGKYYQIGDVFTTASTSETQGLTYLEAIAAMVPVVAKKDASLDGIIYDRETGYLFEEDDALPEILYHVLTNKEEAARIAKKALESIQYLSSEQFAKNIEKLYNDLIERSKQSRKKLTIPVKGSVFKIKIRK